MAKAKAICRCKYCGCEFERTSIQRNRDAADSWEEWAMNTFDECPDCYNKRKEKERLEEQEQAAKDAKEMGFPTLKGTPKQIAWAETIRMSFSEQFSEMAKRYISARKVSPAQMQDMEMVVMSKDDAKFWIDNRDYLTMISINKSWLAEFYKREKDLEQKAETEEKPVILEPVTKLHTTVCNITFTDDDVKVKSDYDPEIPPVLKAAGYKWTGTAWHRSLDVTSGAAHDRAAEIGNKLLLAGFPVTVPEEIRESAVSGGYEPEHKRWFTWDTGKEKLAVWGDVDASKIPGIKGRYIPLESYEEVEEFAETNDYRLSPGAIKAIKEYKERIQKAAVSPGTEKEYTEKDTKDILKSSRDVLQDLIDND